MTRTILSWSGGKDCAMALDAMRRQDDVEVGSLLTTINATYDRSSMHGVRSSLYRQQAAAIGLPIDIVELPDTPSNEVYESIMAEVMEGYVAAGVETIAFADINLTDVRAYREDRLEAIDIEGRWPIWGIDTAAHARSVVDRGFRATVVAVDEDRLDGSFAGRRYDHSFLADLPEEVDPAGENGEFHTFVWDGPIFASPVELELGDVVSRAVGDTTMRYRDLLPGT